MTDEMMALQGLLEQTSDANLVREMLGFAAELLMELDVGGQSGWGGASCQLPAVQLITLTDRQSAINCWAGGHWRATNRTTGSGCAINCTTNFGWAHRRASRHGGIMPIERPARWQVIGFSDRRIDNERPLPGKAKQRN